MVKKDASYRIFFIVGISVLPLGIALLFKELVVGLTFLALSVIFILVGFTHKTTWK